MAKNKDYWLCSDRIVNLILAIFMPTAFILGVITRFQDGKPVAALLRLLTGWNIVWILDIVFMAKEDRIFRLLDC